MIVDWIIIFLSCSKIQDSTKIGMLWHDRRGSLMIRSCLCIKFHHSYWAWCYLKFSKFLTKIFITYANIFVRNPNSSWVLYVSSFLNPYFGACTNSNSYMTSLYFEGHVTILIDNQQAIKYGTSPQIGDGPFKHLADDYDLKYWASILEHNLLRNHKIMVTYQQVYSHQNIPKKRMKIHPGITVSQAIQIAKHPSVHAKVNIACDKEAEAGHIIFHGKQ